jgi:hypothetical protein
MTAEYLVGEIFSRHLDGPTNQRFLTARQFVALRDLILLEEPKGTVHSGLGGSLVWMAPGTVKYVLTEDRVRWKHTLTRMSTAEPAQSGLLF